MKIHKAKTSDYDSVDSKWIANYIQEYAYKVHYVVNENADNMASSGDTKSNTRLTNANRTQLKAIAVDLETALKRLEWMLEGKY